MPDTTMLPLIVRKGLVTKEQVQELQSGQSGMDGEALFVYFQDLEADLGDRQMKIQTIFRNPVDGIDPN